VFSRRSSVWLLLVSKVGDITRIKSVGANDFVVHLGILFYRNYHVGGSSAVDMKFVVRTLIFGVYTLAGML
jgi:hypothetical protein